MNSMMNNMIVIVAEKRTARVRVFKRRRAIGFEPQRTQRRKEEIAGLYASA